MQLVSEHYGELLASGPILHAAQLAQRFGQPKQQIDTRLLSGTTAGLIESHARLHRLSPMSRYCRLTKQRN
ncbi:hypothetical protein ABZV31_07290 [Streptomyces sp. NPDC005202]|uniref:hypothetical protein n=1 Tax=Streptomyces sp. NPDC005202 TaxID=3157021 RepID=UPI0033B625CB